jgi:IS6 family transposase
MCFSIFLTWPCLLDVALADRELHVQDLEPPVDDWRFVGETYVKINSIWRYVYRAIDQDGQVIDVLVSTHREADSARRFFPRALSTLKVTSSEVVTDAAAIYFGVLDEFVAVGVAPRGAAREQSDRGRSQSAQTATSIYVRATDRSAAQVIITGTPLCKTCAADTTKSPFDAPIAERVAAAFAGPRLPLPTLPTTPTTLTFECPCSISSIC